MELHQLEYFVAVAQEQNFTRAAEKLLVSQPGVSAQIRRLERELGESLLDRSGRSVRLTEAGAAVLPYARAALAAVEGAGLVVAELMGLLRGHVAIGAVTSHNVDLPGMLAEFSRMHPQVEITLSEGNTDELIDIVDQPIVAAVSHHHELAAHKVISLMSLRGRPLISLPRGTGLRARLD